MSITANGVKFKRRKGAILLLFLTITEAIFSVLLVVSLGANFLFPQRADAVAGVSAKLSYQGRLTDLSGNTLGGAAGTNYCFRFSIYDAATAGTKQWPAGTPASTTVKVKDGVFNTDLGTADSLSTFDFSSIDTLFLQVEINATPTTCTGAWEALDVRQRIDAVGYARVAEGVYSSLLRAPTGGTAVQIGAGSGAATPIFLNLDVKNTDESVGASCTTNGQLWYNSFDSKSRVCEGSTIQDMIAGILVRDEGTDIGRASKGLDFTGTGVVASKGTGANSGIININIPAGSLSAGTATASLGQIVFSDANGVSFGINGQTLTASVNAGGGANTASFYANAPFVGNSSAWQVSGSTSYIQPFFLPYAISASYVRLPITMSAIGSLAAVGTAVNVTRGLTVSSTINVVVYSQNTGGNSLSLQSVNSGSASWQQRATIQAAGVGSNWSSGHTISYPVTGGNSNFTSSGAATSASFTMQSSQLSNFTNLRYVDIPFANSLAAGPYWIMYGSGTSMSTSGTANMSTLRILASNFVMTQPAQSLNILGNATNSSNHFQIGLGSWSTNVMATTASVALSGISRSASNPQLYFQIIRQN